MNIETKDINDPNTVTSLKHLNEMYENAKLVLINGNPLILIQSIDLGKNYLNQDLFNEVKNDIIVNYQQYSTKMLFKLIR